MKENFNKVFIDTAPFIYLLEFNNIFSNYSENAIKNFGDNSTFITSVITYSEFCVKPKKTNNLFAISDFKDFLRMLECDMKIINLEISDIASDLRAKYKFLKTPDALQLAKQYIINVINS